MPKSKTSSSVAKRFKFTASGELLRRQAGKNHLLQKKTSKHKKNLSRTTAVKKQNMRQIKIKLLK